MSLKKYLHLSSDRKTYSDCKEAFKKGKSNNKKYLQTEWKLMTGRNDIAKVLKFWSYFTLLQQRSPYC